MNEFEKLSLQKLKALKIAFESYKQGIVDSRDLVNISIKKMDEKIFECQQEIFKKEEQNEHP